ncbi:MAG: hypothetical protein WBA74_05840 [Cyclobacteriaceae bacterium]
MSIKKSYEDNKDEILNNLPKEFHADFEKELEDLDKKEPKKLSDDEVKEEVKKDIYSEFHKYADDIDNEINAESSEASDEEREKAIDTVLPEEVKKELKGQ